jgi:hypothetical protein
MGPSGYGFLHPGLISDADPLLDAIVNQTLGAAALLSSSAYVGRQNPFFWLFLAPHLCSA